MKWRGLHSLSIYNHKINNIGCRSFKVQTSQKTITCTDKRSKLLLELSDRNEKDYLDSYIGKTVKVLFEEKVDKEDTYEGFTSNYLKVNVKEKNDIQNKEFKDCSYIFRLGA